MADKKITELPSASILTGDEIVPIVQDNTTKSASVNTMLAGAYKKPASGIPGQDLEVAIQMTLGKADSALQTETDPVFSASAAAAITNDSISSWNGKQNALVSGTNIKTINGESLLGEGNIAISGGTGEIYSENETRIGTWIDGKPLYRKVYANLGAVPMKTNMTLFTLSEDISIRNMVGYIFTESPTGKSVCATGIYVTIYTIDTEVIIYQTFSSYVKDAVVILEYTKTTD